jgi:hypothetical protein
MVETSSKTARGGGGATSPDQTGATAAQPSPTLGLTAVAVLPGPAEAVVKIETLAAQLAYPRYQHMLSLSLTIGANFWHPGPFIGEISFDPHVVQLIRKTLKRSSPIPMSATSLIARYRPRLPALPPGRDFLMGHSVTPDTPGSTSRDRSYGY